ncbi:hypothetical protein EDB85DRAFT_1307075 [Lactarius pseudohatsudake]|nr:hypothetical protein EDB85DRAFT_1307075 [Lactarius pseudohatsudake]
MAYHAMRLRILRNLELLVAAHANAIDAEFPLTSLSRTPSDAHSITHTHTKYASAYAPHTKQRRARTHSSYDGCHRRVGALPFDSPFMLDAAHARRAWGMRIARLHEQTCRSGGRGTSCAARMSHGPRLQNIVVWLLVSNLHRRAHVVVPWDKLWTRHGEAVLS